VLCGDAVHIALVIMENDDHLTATRRSLRVSYRGEACARQKEKREYRRNSLHRRAIWQKLFRNMFDAPHDRTRQRSP
jgi:hypothetical protein